MLIKSHFYLHIEIPLVTLQVTLSTKIHNLGITLHQERFTKIVNDYIMLERRFVFGESQKSFEVISIPLRHTYVRMNPTKSANL